MSNDYIVKPVFKALQVLRCLGEERRELSMKEICYRVGLPKTTVFRYLHTLCDSGFVSHDPKTDLYRVGLRVWELGQAVHEPQRMREIALPLMRDLRDRYNETVNLGILDGSDVVYLEMTESRRSLRMQALLGGRDPAYSTALGKAILAFMPADQWTTYMPANPNPRTARTLLSLAGLQHELAATRERGFAVDDEENEEGACCIGAPIFDTSGQVCAAVSVSAPASRLNGSQILKTAQAVIQTAQAISTRLGYRKVNEP
jgi:IclR family acetate operon transcriptional repressor